MTKIVDLASLDFVQKKMAAYVFNIGYFHDMLW